MSETDFCPFCAVAHERIILSNNHGIVIPDGFPIAVGHTLILPRRHAVSFFMLTSAERTSLLDLLIAAKATLDAEHRPAAYNIGINDGAVAGQTIPHMHIHLIPRYAGDSTDPRGGVRWVLPEKAKYWP